MSPILIVILILLIVAALIISYHTGQSDGGYEGQKRGFRDGIVEGRKQLIHEQAVESAQKVANIVPTPRGNRRHK